MRYCEFCGKVYPNDKKHCDCCNVRLQRLKTDFTEPLNSKKKKK